MVFGTTFFVAVVLAKRQFGKMRGLSKKKMAWHNMPSLSECNGVTKLPMVLTDTDPYRY